MPRSAGMVAVLLLAACTERRLPEHDALLCDASTSSFCTADVVRGAAIRFIRSNPPPGSTFEVIATGCATDDAERVYSIATPPRWGAGVAAKKRVWRQEEEHRLATLTLPPRRRCSGIASGIWRAGTTLRELGGDGRLIVVSDLRETGQGLAVNFERNVPSAALFVERLRAAHLIVDLSRITIEVCRVHSARTPDSPRWSAEKTERLKLSWGAGFDAMGHPGVELKERCSWEAAIAATLAEARP